MSLTTAATLPYAIKEVWDKRALMNARDNLFQNRWARPGMLPQNVGDTYEWYRINDLSTVSTALSAGVTPQPHTPAEIRVRGTIDWYGAYILHDDRLEYTAYHPVIQHFTDILGYQCGASINDLTRTQQAAGLTNIVWPGSNTADSTVAAGEVMTFSLFARALANLMGNNAKPAEGQSYVAIMHPFVYFDFIQDDQVQNAFREAAQADGVNPYRTGFVGEIAGCKIYVTSRALVTADAGAGNVDIYTTMFFGKPQWVAQAA